MCVYVCMHVCVCMCVCVCVCSRVDMCVGMHTHVYDLRMYKCLPVLCGLDILSILVCCAVRCHYVWFSAVLQWYLIVLESVTRTGVGDNSRCSSHPLQRGVHDSFEGHELGHFPEITENPNMVINLLYRHAEKLYAIFSQ